MLDLLDDPDPSPFPLPGRPTSAPPGSPAKISAMYSRLWDRRGPRHLHHPDDAPMDAESGPRRNALYCHSDPARDAFAWDDDDAVEDVVWVVPRRWASLITTHPVRAYPEPLEPLKDHPKMSTITPIATAPAAASIAVPNAVTTVPAGDLANRPTIAIADPPTPKKRPGPPRKFTDEERRARKAAYRRAQYQRQKQQAAAQAAQQAPAVTSSTKAKAVAIAAAEPARGLPAREQGILLSLVRRHGLAAVRAVLDQAEAEARKMLGLN